jgi:hypothetical protein
MSDLRERYKKETGNKVGATVDFECEYCGVEDGIEGWSDEYVFWLENLVNSAEKIESNCDIPHVSNNEVAVCEHGLSKQNQFCVYCESWYKCTIPD